jgi:adenylate kinase family enzyme
MGNAGAGKTTLAKALVELEDAARLSLDEVAFSEGPERRKVAESVAAAVSFVDRNDSWIIEGCYSDIVEPLLASCDTLVFLNPGVDACIAHCRKRPWEREKFSSASEQDANLESLISWVGQYETRTDEYGLIRHRRLFDSFQGRKFEFTTVVPDAAQRIVASNT